MTVMTEDSADDTVADRTICRHRHTVNPSVQIPPILFKVGLSMCGQSPQTSLESDRKRHFHL
jgi:hypothetical protein